VRRACAQVATQLCRPAVRVVHMEAGVNAADVRAQLRGGLAHAVLLDSKGGGTGKTFDWEVGGEVQERVPFILAGGLTPQNVGDAVRRVRPWCVDTSSGVETDGVKDHEKITSFVAGAKAALAA
jgi:phosphoribosylanthranilate isomerase